MTLEESLTDPLSQKKPVFRAFYDRFLADVPEAARLFEGVDLKQQSLMLTMGLIVVEAHAKNDFASTQHYLHVLGDRHQEWGVPQELFWKFRDCLIETLAEWHDSDWSADLEDSWGKAIDRAIIAMLEGYAGNFPF
jgi:hemoglobin-like flavoprotein